jgi:hypothetical protein
MDTKVNHKKTCEPAWLCSGKKCSDLINPVTEQWDDDLVFDLFGEDDAKHILEIPLRSGMEDHLAWHYDSKGVFSVKSAYQLGVSIRDAKHRRDASSSSGRFRPLHPGSNYGS